MKFSISPLLIIMILLLIICGKFLLVISYLAAVMVHEFCHAAVAEKLGYELNGIKLNPYGASLTGAFEGVKPRDEILIAVAGPLSNAFLAILFVALWWLVPEAYSYTLEFVSANVYTFVFNLFPVFPLDGGRALLALLSSFMPRQKAYKTIRWFGLFAGGIFFVFFLLSIIFAVNFTLASIGAFIIMSTFFEDKNSKYQRLYGMAFRKERIMKGMKIREIAVSARLTIFAIYKMQHPSSYNVFTVLDDSFNKIAEITETDLERLLISNSGEKTIIEVLPLNT